MHTTLLGLLFRLATGAPAALASASLPRMLSEVPPSGLLCAPATASIRNWPTGLVEAGSGCYNTSAVTIMMGMFMSTTFNDPVPMDTSSVTNMLSVFRGATAFNQPLVWDTSSVTTMKFMFRDATAFDQPLAWDTSSVRGIDFMFDEATAFNQPLAWDTSSVTDMGAMLQGTPAFAQELDAWDVGAVTKFGAMFMDSRMSTEAVSGGIGFGRACRIHHSWKAQNDAWNPVTAGLVANEAELDLSLCAPHVVRPPSSPPLSEVAAPSGLLCAPATLSIKFTPDGLLWMGGGCYDTSAVTDINSMFTSSSFNDPVPMDTSSVT